MFKNLLFYTGGMDSIILSKLHLMVNDYKRYLDKTFENDKGNMYTKIMHEAYVHYYLDKMNLDFLKIKRSSSSGLFKIY